MAKCIAVEWVSQLDADDCDTFEISFDSSPSKSDLEIVLTKLKVKSKFVSDSCQGNDVLFKKESVRKKGMFVGMGDKSPVSDGATLKCVLKPKKLFTVSGNSVLDQNSAGKIIFYVFSMLHNFLFILKLL